MDGINKIRVFYVEVLNLVDRKAELLIAAYKLLEKQVKSNYVLNLLATTVHYDDAECDGSCLMEDIEYCLEEEGIDLKNFLDYHRFIRR